MVNMAYITYNFDMSTKTVVNNPAAVVRVDLEQQTVSNIATGHSEKFEIDAYKKHCLLNGFEVTLPVATDAFPYYKWSDLRAHYQAKIDAVE